MDGLSKLRIGVSEVIASLLLILIAASLGISLYLFFTYSISAQVSSLTYAYTYGSALADTRFKVTWSTYISSNNTFIQYIYNYGDKVVFIDSIYIDGVRYAVTPQLKVLPGDIVEYRMSIILSPGVHIVKIVDKNGVGYEYQFET
jgi:hypothetical protein